VIKIVGKYSLNWALNKAVNRDSIQQSLYDFLFIENALIFKGKHRDADTVVPVALKTFTCTFFVMFL
jgi:hypothetical protein